jgi:hypothetical protein
MESIVNIFLYLLGVMLVAFVFYILWKFYAKTGRPGWGAFVPIYSSYLMVKIAGRPGWWTLLMFVPIVNIVIAIIISLDIAAAFGRSALFGVFGLMLFSIVGYGILALGDDTYTQPVNE